MVWIHRTLLLAGPALLERWIGRSGVPVVYEFSEDPIAIGIATDLAHLLFNATWHYADESGTERQAS